MFSSTGLVEGQLFPAYRSFEPIVTDAVGVTRVDIAVDGIPASSPDRPSCRMGTSAATAGRVACRVLTWDLPDDSDMVIRLTAWDAAGNHTTAVTTVHVDRVRPVAAVSPAAGTAMTSRDLRITLNGVSPDVVRTTMLEGYPGKVLSTRTGAPWAFDWKATGDVAAPVFELTDRAGNVTYLDSRYIVDDDAPVIERIDGDLGNRNLERGGGWVGGSATLTATVDDKSGVARSEWRVNGVLTSTEPVFAWNAKAVPAATAKVELRVWDRTGHTAARSFVVNIDKSGPKVTVYPAERALIRGKTFVTSIKASDPHGVVLTSLQGPQNQINPAVKVTLNAGKDGSRKLVWIAADGYYNYTTVTRTVIVDNTAPSVAYKKAPKNKAKLTKKTTLTATAADRNGVARVQLLVNGKVVATDTKAGYSFTLNPKKYGKKFTVQLRAYDKAGNVKVSAKRTYRR
ncbi:hypothetical protein ACTI_42270 [Actinoplanes sp. OR16]|nr:hypothetical protein ACTI_42270 [Actinoplanes sp. OR16]